MNLLNTDCLLEITKLLNLKDQISLYQVNSTLQALVIALWRLKYKNLHLNFLEQTFSNEEFAIFIKSINDIVEKLQLRFLNKEKYEIIKQHCFERVTNFRFTLYKPFFMKDDDVRNLKDVFPNLVVFSPHGNLSGRYMDQWPTLKDLNLNSCSTIEVIHFQNIMSQLKLEKLHLNIYPNNIQIEQINMMDAHMENLRYLKLNTYEFYYFLAKPLTALKELIITNKYNPRQLFDVLLSIWQAKEISLVETANVNNILINCLEMHLNVEQLIIVNDENALPSNIIPSLHILTDLRKLRFEECYISSKDFTNLLNIHQLHEISFAHCQFDSVILHIKVEEVVAQRTKKLRLNMFENILMDYSSRPDWYKKMEQIYILVDVTGSHKLWEMTQIKEDELCFEPLRAIFR